MVDNMIIHRIIILLIITYYIRNKNMRTFIKVCLFCGVAIWLCGYALVKIVEALGYTI